jgi:hypothetical protein
MTIRSQESQPKSDPGTSQLYANSVTVTSPSLVTIQEPQYT